MPLIRVRKSSRIRAEEIQKKLSRFYGKKIPLTKIIDHQLNQPFKVDDKEIKNFQKFRRRLS